MPDGRYLLNDIEFEQAIKEMDDRQLLEFTARQTYSISNTVAGHDKRIKSLEGQSNRRSGFIGGAGAIIGAAVSSIVDYLVRRG